MAYQIKLRRDTRENWEIANPILGLAEWACTLDTEPQEVRIGDGQTPWKELVPQYLNNLKPVFLTEEEFDSILVKDENTMYYIIEE